MARIAPLRKEYNAPKVPDRRASDRRLIDPAYKEWLSGLPCCVTLREPVHVHHLTIGRNRMGVKADDNLCVPLSPGMHNQGPEALHEIGETNFWRQHGIEPFNLAYSLYRIFHEHSADERYARAVIGSTRELGIASLEWGFALFPDVSNTKEE